MRYQGFTIKDEKGFTMLHGDADDLIAQHRTPLQEMTHTTIANAFNAAAPGSILTLDALKKQTKGYRDSQYRPGYSRRIAGHQSSWSEVYISSGVSDMPATPVIVICDTDKQTVKFMEASGTTGEKVPAGARIEAFCNHYGIPAGKMNVDVFTIKNTQIVPATSSTEGRTEFIESHNAVCTMELPLELVMSRMPKLEVSGPAVAAS